MIATADTREFASTTYTYTPRVRRTAREIAVDEARRVQHAALIWLIISILQVLFFAFCMGLPSAQAELAAEPLLIIPCLPFLVGAVLYITYGYNHDYQKAEDMITNRRQR